MLRLTSPRLQTARGGQVLVIVGLLLFAITGMVAVVIDGGHAWGRQRETQNAADAMAKAGAAVIQLGMVDDAITDCDVLDAVQRVAAAGDTQDDPRVTLETATYTDHRGTDLGIAVGSRCTSTATSGGQGIKVTATHEFSTYLGGVFGLPTLTSNEDATAIVGAVDSVCAAPAGCGVLPFTFPQVGYICDSTAAPFEIRTDDGDGGWEPFEIVPQGTPLTTDNMASVPLCDTAPGSVGWLSICGDLQASIRAPCNPDITIPSWLSAVDLGPDSEDPGCCEAALNAYAGANLNAADADDDVLLVPVHTNTCTQERGGCAEGAWSGLGPTIRSYYVPIWMGFKLDQAYTQSSDQCEVGPGGPILVAPISAGEVGCLKGWFVELVVAPGSITATNVTDGTFLTGVTLVE